MRIIGIVKDFHFLGLHQPIEPLVIFPMGSFPGTILTARLAEGRIPEAMSFIEQKWRDIYPDHPFVYTFMDDEFDNTYQRDRNTSQVVNVFSALAIFIACLGLIGLVAFTSAVRTKEIGIRKTLGAGIPTIIRLLSKEVLWLIFISTLIAWPVAWFGVKYWLQNFADHIGVNPFIFILATFISLVIGWLAISFQAIKAAMANPVDALKYE